MNRRTPGARRRRWMVHPDPASHSRATSVAVPARVVTNDLAPMLRLTLAGVAQSAAQASVTPPRSWRDRRVGSPRPGTCGSPRDLHQACTSGSRNCRPRFRGAPLHNVQDDPFDPSRVRRVGRLLDAGAGAGRPAGGPARTRPCSPSRCARPSPASIEWGSASAWGT